MREPAAASTQERTMRTLILIGLVTTTGCAGARQSWAHRYDSSHRNRPEDAKLAAESFRHQPPTPPPPVDVSRSTESGPSGGAGVGPRAN
jgi:hypothetical protein